jgi:hypothetical protein
MRFDPGENVMDQLNLLADDQRVEREERRAEPQAIGDVLAELFAQYEARFPHLHMTIVGTTADAA